MEAAAPSYQGPGSRVLGSGVYGEAACFYKYDAIHVPVGYMDCRVQGTQKQLHLHADHAIAAATVVVQNTCYYCCSHSCFVRVQGPGIEGPPRVQGSRVQGPRVELLHTAGRLCTHRLLVGLFGVSKCTVPLQQLRPLLLGMLLPVSTHLGNSSTHGEGGKRRERREDEGGVGRRRSEEGREKEGRRGYKSKRRWGERRGIEGGADCVCVCVCGVQSLSQSFIHSYIEVLA